MTTLIKAIRERAIVDPCGIAFEGLSGPIDWARAAMIVDRTAARLRTEFDADRPIGLSLDHEPESALLLAAIVESGCISIPLPPFFTSAQREAALASAGAAHLVNAAFLDGDELRLETEARSTMPVDIPAGTATITFTSGSTGDPKGICLSASHLITVAGHVAEFVGSRHVGRHLAILPFGILLENVAGLFASLLAGATYIALPAGDIGLERPFAPDMVAMMSAIAAAHATSLILVPEYLAALVAAMEMSGTRFPLLTVLAVGGARVAPDLLLRARAVGLPVRQGYGLTEAGSVITLEDRSDGKVGSVGRSIGAHRVLIADDGEIIVDGPLFLVTVGCPRPPGPYHTGDIGRVDAGGRLWIEGRKSNLIVTSFGRNLSPEWIEGLLLDQAEIAQAMVRGDGESTLEALVVPNSQGADIQAAVMRVNAALPAYARLARITPVSPFTPFNGQLTGNGRLRRSAIDIAHPRETETMPFFDRLVADTNAWRARFSAVPQLAAGLTGNVSIRDYRAYLAQAYHHVRHTVPLMREARARLAGNAMLALAFDDYIQDELGHEQWILDDITAAGGDADAVAASDPAPATAAMVDHAYQAVRHGNPVSLFGMVFVLEGTSVAMASQGAAAVQASLGLPASAFRYLSSHGALDREHMKFFEGLMNCIDDPADQRAIVQMARDMFDLFGAVFASIELEAAHDAT